MGSLDLHFALKPPYLGTNAKKTHYFFIFLKNNFVETNKHTIFAPYNLVKTILKTLYYEKILTSYHSALRMDG